MVTSKESERSSRYAEAKNGKRRIKWGGAKFTGHWNTFYRVWKMTEEELRHEPLYIETLHILQIISYCDPDRTFLDDLQQVYELSAPHQIGGDGKIPFDSVVEALRRRAIVRVPQMHPWAIRLGWVETQGVLQKLIREGDTKGDGIKSILVAKKYELELKIHQSRLESKDTCPHYLQQNDAF